MKKFVVPLLIALFHYNGATAQTCIPNIIIFEQQASIDNFQSNYPNCTEIEGDVFIKGYFIQSIHNLEGLSVLTAIRGSLYIEDNWELTSLAGLDNLVSIGGFCSIYNNKSLSSLSDLHNLNSIGGSLLISTNPSLTVLTGLDNLTFVGGYLGIESDDALINLSAFDKLTSMGGDLYINGNDLLPSLSGLHNLTSVGISIFIVNNSSLTNLAGLDNVTSVGGYIEINQNNNMTSLAGLENVASVMVRLTIKNNNSLVNLTGLENLASIVGSLEIEENNSLTSLSGLENLTSIGGSLIITSNPALTTLSGIQNLTSSSILSLNISSNDLLSDCDVKTICDFLAWPGGPMTIIDNAGGCESPEQIAALCEFGINDFTASEKHFLIYPNPVSDKLTVKLATSELNNHTILKIYSPDGKQIYSQAITELECNPDMSGLTQGVYFVQLKNDKRVVTLKIVKE